MGDIYINPISPCYRTCKRGFSATLRYNKKSSTHRNLAHKQVGVSDLHLLRKHLLNRARNRRCAYKSVEETERETTLAQFVTAALRG
jgi:hypothetical protein